MVCMMVGDPATANATAAVTPRPTNIHPYTVRRGRHPFGCRVGGYNGTSCRGEIFHGCFLRFSMKRPVELRLPSDAPASTLTTP